MSDLGRKPRGVHLVGSVPLASSAEVFRTAGRILGPRLRRVPDGETGVRSNWIRWQSAVFQDHGLLETAPAAQDAYRPRARFRLRSSSNEITFDNLGYADAAAASYDELSRLKRAGDLPSDLRFQVSLPTPLAPVYSFVDPDDQAAIEPAYEAAMLAELGRITEIVPHGDLAIQWDVAVEFAVLEGVGRVHFGDAKAGIIERLVRLGDQVERDVELGYHLCYGDSGHKHFKEPKDTSILVEVANAVSAGVRRPIDWVHMPVPRDRADDAYYRPLEGLELSAETELYLGLVHFTDGVEGTRRRIKAAQRFVSDFGVGTECGLGRRPPDTVPELLEVHAQVAVAADSV